MYVCSLSVLNQYICLNPCVHAHVICTCMYMYMQLLTDRGSNGTEKFPSFELVLNFVGNEAISEEKVSSLLKQRSESARAVAQAYGFIADYIEMATVQGLFEVSL